MKKESESSLDYRSVLRDKLGEKFKSNPHLSLRAVAKRSGLSHPMLSQVLGGRRNLTRESASKLIEFLDFTEEQKEHFLAMVEYSTTKSQAYREILLRKLTELAPRNEALILNNDIFQIVKDWYHSPILELSRITGLELTPKSIAQSLRLPELVAKSALDRLLKLGLLKRVNGKLVKAASTILSTHEVPSASVREHHRQMIAKASEALEAQDISRRSITDMTIAISKDQVALAKAEIERFKGELSLKLNRTKSRTAVYQLNIQFFELTEFGTEKPPRIDAIKTRSKYV